MKTLIVVPADWIDLCKDQEERLKSFQPFSLGTYVFPQQATRKKSVYNYFTGEVGKDVDLVLWVLPNYMATGAQVKYWPRVYDTHNNINAVNALCFADTIEEFIVFLKESKKGHRGGKTFISCQYEHPYTAMLDKWSRAGAKPLHPGEYFKNDFLETLATMKGSWVYFGHALGDRLRGYGHLLTQELCRHRPAKPLTSTLWFTCSTLSSKTKKNIGLSWYLSGATNCLLASPEAVKTEANQVLGRAWLAQAKKKKVQSIAQLLLYVGKHSSSQRKTLSQYCLLGNPWIPGNLK